MINLEDSHEDILAKSMSGLKLGKKEMAKRIGLPLSRVNNVLSGVSDLEVIHLMASELKLDPKKLSLIAKKNYLPESISLIGLKQFNLPFRGMKVNHYILWNEKTRHAWLFDVGPDANEIVDFVRSTDLNIVSIFLTHTHLDHIYCINELRGKVGNPPVWVHQLETIINSVSIVEGYRNSLGGIKLVALHTHGHSVGGLTYLIDGLPCPVAIVGDALFAGSMGGGMVSYADALKTNREKIMTLPDNCVLCPGHGPMTTVGEEKKYNPFFPEFP